MVLVWKAVAVLAGQTQINDLDGALFGAHAAGTAYFAPEFRLYEDSSTVPQQDPLMPVSPPLDNPSFDPGVSSKKFTERTSANEIDRPCFPDRLVDIVDKKKIAPDVAFPIFLPLALEGMIRTIRGRGVDRLKREGALRLLTDACHTCLSETVAPSP